MRALARPTAVAVLALVAACGGGGHRGPASTPVASGESVARLEGMTLLEDVGATRAAYTVAAE